MNISTALIRTDPADDPTSGFNGALVHGSLSNASPGRTLALFYSSLAQTIEAKANRVAHNWGRGPAAITEQIDAFFGTGKERLAKLEELRSNGYPWLEKRCSKLTEYALPRETAKTQLQAFRSIVAISTRYPGCRDLCFKSQHLCRAGKDEATISAVWARSDDYRPPHWDFFYKFAAACLSETDISGILAGVSPRILGSVQVDGGVLSVIERLLIASKCSDSVTSTGSIARRYLFGVLELPTFWDESGLIHTAIFHKLVMWLIEMLKDLGLDSADTTHTPEMNMDIETIDSMVATVLSGVCRWAITMDLESQCWFGSLGEVVRLLQGPQAEDLLPSSWKLATCSEVRKLVPRVTDQGTSMTAETSFTSDNYMSMSGRTLCQPINKPTPGPGVVPHYLDEHEPSFGWFVLRRRRLTRRATDLSVKYSQPVPRHQSGTGGWLDPLFSRPRSVSHQDLAVPISDTVSGSSPTAEAHRASDVHTRTFNYSFTSDSAPKENALGVPAEVATPAGTAHSNITSAMDAGHGRLGGDGGGGVCAPTEHPQSSQSLTSIPLDCTGRKKALLIGIRTSRTGGYPELKAPHDDVHKMQKLLLDVYNYTPTEITILMDDGLHVQPTRANILAAIADLVKDVKDGDQLFFHYSGHSTQVENPRSKSEEDGKDECLIPWDGEEMKIIDNELHASLVAPLPAGAHLVAVLDTCHSGSLLDLKHYRCNRVPVPWLYRGRRNSEEPRNRVVRQGARLLTLSQTGGPAHQAHNARSTPSKRRSITSVMCDPPVSSTPSSRSSTYTSTGLTHAGTSSTPTMGPLARLRNASASARARAASLSLSLSIPAPAPAPAASKDKENLTSGVGPVLPALSKLTWILPDEEAHCESPVGQFPCNGWCHNLERQSTCVAQDTDDEVKADVISLASCKDSGLVWEADGVSMTSTLVDLLQENPHQSLKEVLMRISHATHSLALVRHGKSQAYKRNRKAYAAFLKRHIARLERGNRSTASLVPSPTSDPNTPRNVRLTRRPTFPVNAGAMDASRRGKMKGFVKRVDEQIASLKQQLLDMGNDRGYNMDMFQNPELASAKPLDMNRQWRM